MLTFAVTAMSRPAAARTARTTSSANRARFSRLPPNSSVRLFSFGERNALEQVAVPDVDFDRVEARVAQHAGAVRVLLDDRRDVARRSPPGCGACRAG